MLTAEWDKMSGVERDAWFVQHLFVIPVFASWTLVERSGGDTYPFAVYDRRAIKDPCEGIRIYHPRGIPSDGIIWSPTRNIEHAFQVEDKIREQVVSSLYAQKLWKVLFPSKEFSWEKVFSVIHATSGQRCKAAYLALTHKAN
ncbi:MAG: hypothetical protein ICV60_05600 [Pyrinomonadaceae bacterium]|nr:hypothetical protein [Pyrinomonadaceae bacterium]